MDDLENGSDEMRFGEADRVAWVTFEATVRCWLPLMPLELLRIVAAELRPGSGGSWEQLSADLDARRELLLADVVGAAAGLLGGPWPILGDALPSAPDSPAGLIA
jgi:hypothetical protein